MTAPEEGEALVGALAALRQVQDARDRLTEARRAFDPDRAEIARLEAELDRARAESVAALAALNEAQQGHRGAA